MTNPIPDEAVDAALRAAYDELPHIPGTDDEQFYEDLAATIARKVLTVAAPHIAAQAAKHERERTAIAIARLIRARANATLDDRERLSGNISAGYALVFAGIWHKNALLSDDPVAAECDHLRAGIEALRDKWWKSESEAPGFDYAMSRAADALDALLPERAR